MECQGFQRTQTKNNATLVKNYLFFTLPRMTVMSKTKIIGFGFAGNVIWFDEIKKPNQN